MANRNSPQSPPLQDQVPNQKSIGAEIPLDSDMPEPEPIHSAVAWDDESDNFLGLFYRLDVEALEERANITNFMVGGLGSQLKNQNLHQISLISSRLCMGINGKSEFSITSQW